MMSNAFAMRLIQAQRVVQEGSGGHRPLLATASGLQELKSAAKPQLAQKNGFRDCRKCVVPVGKPGPSERTAHSLSPLSPLSPLPHCASQGGGWHPFDNALQLRRPCRVAMCGHVWPCMAMHGHA